jgi:hypothetical protein
MSDIRDYPNPLLQALSDRYGSRLFLLQADLSKDVLDARGQGPLGVLPARSTRSKLCRR